MKEQSISVETVVVEGKTVALYPGAVTASTIEAVVERFVACLPDGERYALLLVHPGRSMTPELEMALTVATAAGAEVFFTGNGSSSQLIRLPTPTARGLSLNGRPRESVVEKLSARYNNLLVVSSGDSQVALALDKRFGTQTALRNIRQDVEDSATRVIDTDFERYRLIPGGGLALERQRGTQPKVVVLPKFHGLDVAWIGARAFEASAVELVHLPSTVTSIGFRAFADCRNLATLTLPASTKNVMQEAFSNTGLTALTIPEGVASLGERSFAGCSRLTTVSLPRSLRFIDESAFDGVDEGVVFHVVQDSYAHDWVRSHRRAVRVFDARREEDLEALDRTSKMVKDSGFTYRSISDGTLELASVLKAHRSRSRLSIPSVVNGAAVIGIGERAFRGVSRLKTLEVPDQVKWIRTKAFRECPEMSEVGIKGGAGLLYVAPDAFRAKNAGAATSRAKLGPDTRTARLTPRMLLTHIGENAPEGFPRELLDSELSRIVHIPAQVSEGSAFFYWHDDNDFHEDPNPQGHLEQAMELGASLLVSQRRIDLPDGRTLPTILVDHPRDLFREINTMMRRQYDPKTVTVTGSIGKTTTKQMLEVVARNAFTIKVSEGNNNNVNFTGRVFSTLNRSHEVYIQETGASYFGQVEALNRIAQPDALVVTNIGTNHIADYGESQEELLRDKISADRFLPPGGVIVLNYDDPLLRSAEIRSRVISIGIDSEDVDYRAVEIREEMNRLRFVVEDRLTRDRTPVVIKAIGTHNAYSALSAFAIGRWLGIEAADIAVSLQDFRPERLRQAVMRFDDQHVLVDCYNASEKSVLSSAKSLQQLPRGSGGRRIYVFGDLTNRGALSEGLHRQIGEDLATEAQLDLLVCYGEDSLHTAVAARKHGLETYHTDSFADLCHYLKETMTPADALGFKASRRMRLEQAIDVLFGTNLAIAPNARRFIDKMEEVTYEGLIYKHIPVRGLGAFSLDQESLTRVGVPAHVQGVPVDVIMHECFVDSQLESVTLRAPLRSIGRDAFRRCRKLARVELPDTLRVIDSRAFSACNSLTEITIPEGVQEIGANAFRYCRRLRTIRLPDSLQTIGDNIFVNCSSDLVVVCNEGTLADKYVTENYPEMARLRPQFDEPDGEAASE